MGVGKALFLWMTCYLLLLKAHSKCPPSFPCKNYTLQFPFTEVKEPGCGLFPVDGCDSQYENPIAHIGFEPFATSIEILEKRSESMFLVEDLFFQSLLDLRSCSVLSNMSITHSPFVSFTISPNLTLLKCLRNSHNETTAAEHFKNYFKKECDDFIVYYNPLSNDTLGETSGIPSGCSKVQLPKSNASVSDDLFDLFSAKFVVKWSVSKDCADCYNGGGQCLTDNQNKLYCKQGANTSRSRPNADNLAGNKTIRNKILIGGLTAAVLASISIILILFIGRKYDLLRLFAFEKAKWRNDKYIELFLKNNGNLAPKRYKYSDIKKMTNSFKKNLGKGGYGSVYKGKLPDGHPVAVKMLDESKGNGEDFMNEVASISRTSHVNIVNLLGFCFEGSKRALIYEFMPNGSLEKFISNTATEGGLGWQKLLDIALGIARGLDYLHQGCKTRIIHFDIKPHNILLDKDFNPRISDFGLARLCPNRSSIVLMMVARGTLGYIAPEVFCRNFGEVSHKSDVYSYGMMVLEIAGGKKNIDRADVDRTSETYFPDYIYNQLETDEDRDDTPVEIMNEDESRFAKRKLIIVGLWCVQTDPKNRPSMSKVVEMLEGKLESLHVPPKPNMSSPPRSPPKFSTSVSSPPRSPPKS